MKTFNYILSLVLVLQGLTVSAAARRKMPMRRGAQHQRVEEAAVFEGETGELMPTITVTSNNETRKFATNLLGWYSFDNNADEVKKILAGGKQHVNYMLENTDALSPLMAATVSKKDTSEIIRLLLENGANLYAENFVDHNFAAMLGAKYDGNRNNIKTLINGGFDIDKKNSLGVSFKEFLSKENAELLKWLEDEAKRKQVYQESVSQVIPISGVANVVLDYLKEEGPVQKEEPAVCGW